MLKIRSTVQPESKPSFNEWAMKIRNELLVEVPKHRKASRFHLNKFKS